MHEIDPCAHVDNTSQQPLLAPLAILASAMHVTKKSLAQYAQSRGPHLHPLSSHDNKGNPVPSDIVAAGVVYTLLDSLDLALTVFENAVQDPRPVRFQDPDMPY